MNITGSMYKWGFRNIQNPHVGRGYVKSQSPFVNLEEVSRKPRLGWGGVVEIPGPLFVGWKDIPESIYWRELKIPWPMCRKEETPGLMWKEGGEDSKIHELVFF